MSRRFTFFTRAGWVLLALALFIYILPSAFAFTNENGQAAVLALGQPDFTSNTPATAADRMNAPVGIAIDPTSGKLFVADYTNNRVLRFASGTALATGAAAEGVLGQPNFTSSAPASTASGMHLPAGVAVDSAGTLWVADFNNSRVLRFDAAAGKPNGAAADGVLGQPDFTSITPATTASTMNQPRSVAVDSAGTLWVSEQSNRVLRFDSAAGKANGANADGVLGQPDFTSSATAATGSGMNLPTGIAVDSAGTLWVADYLNNRVLRFDNATGKADGAAADGVLGQANFTSSLAATTAGGMSRPFGVAVDSTGTLWVAELANNRVLRFASAAAKANGANADGVLGQANFTSKLAPDPATASALNTPLAVAIDDVDNLWVADTYNHRLLRFEPPISWSTPAAIPYGTALSSTQLNASNSVPGTFSYTPAAGTVLNAGARTLSVTFTPTDTSHYSSATKTVLIDVTQIPQAITFAAPADKTYGDPAFLVSATGGSSGQPVMFGSSTSAVCTVSGATVTIVGGGLCTITADQAGDTNYAAAPQMTRTFTVAPGSQTITFAGLAAKTYGDVTFALSATASSGLPVSFSVSSGPATFASNVITITGAGTVVVRASQSGDTSYAAAPDVDQSFSVNPAPLTITAANATKIYGAGLPVFNATATGLVHGDTLANLDTPVTFATSASAASNVGSYSITPSAADPNYTISFVNGTLNVTPRTLTITANNKSKHIGTANPPLTVSYSGFANGDSAASLVPPVRVTTPATISSALGDYPITAGDAANPNYAITFAPGTLTVIDSAYFNGQPASLVLGQPDFTSNTAALTASGMNVPFGVAIDPISGKVFVADANNKRVLRFASGAALINGAAADGVFGQPNFTSNTPATSASGMGGPSGVAVDSAGRLWVADSGNQRVLRFDNAASKANGAAADGVLGQANFTSSIIATTASGMYNPFGVAVDSAGRLWVADASNSRVLRFDNAAGKANGANADGVLGQPNFTSKVGATSVGGMAYPFGVAVDSTGNLWVAEYLNSRVLRFDSAAGKANGANADGVLGQANFTSSAPITSAAGMFTPYGVVVDSIGRLWVADTNNRRVLRFDGAAGKANGANADGVLGQADFTSTTQATTRSGMAYPSGVAIDPAGNLWVVDNANSRVLRFGDAVMPTLTWDNPAAIPYGTPLSSVQLNASANVPGTFSYTPAAGTLLNGGSGQTLSVRFTPTDRITYDVVTATVKIDVSLTGQTITFGAPANKTYGDANFLVSATASSGLAVSFSSSTPAVCTISGSTVQILAAGICMITANQSGNASYTAAPAVEQSFTSAPAPLIIVADDQIKHVGTANPPLTANYYGFVNGDNKSSLAPAVSLATTADINSPVGDYPISASGAANPNYTITFVPGTLTVTNQEFPVISWPTPSAISYGTALSNAQLNAAASVPGTFSYTPPLGTLLNAGPAQRLSVLFTPTDPISYTGATASVLIDVAQASQTITFAAPANKTYGDTSFALNATTNSGLPVSFSSNTPAVCTISGSTVQILAAGTCTVVANQDGDTNYTAALEVEQSITVAPAPLTITANDQIKHIGTPNPALTASYSGFVNGDDKSSLVPPVNLATTAATNSPLGDYAITASGAANPNYTITFIAGTLTVAAKLVPTITWADPTAITYGTALSDAQLNAAASVPGTFSYTPAAGTVLNAGNSQLLEVLFTPSDTGAYASVIAQVNINVVPAPLTITADDKTRAIGAANPALTATYTGFVNGDTAASLDAPAVLATSATASSLPGTYPITVSGAADANYTITFTPGTLSVAPFRIYLPIIHR